MITRKCHRVFVTLTSQHDGKQVSIAALEVPSICAITSPRVTDDVRSLIYGRGLLAADAIFAPAHMEQQISLLVGSDYYWQVTSGNISRLTPHLTTVETLFGWTHQGAHSDGSGYPSAQSSALFLALGEPSSDDIAADEELSSLWRLDAIGIK